MECPSMSMRRFFSSVTVPQCSGRWGHFGRVVAVNRKFRGWGVLGYYFFCAPVAQLAEATDSKPVQCEFESHLGHLLPPLLLVFVLASGGFVLVSCVVTFGSRVLLLDAMDTNRTPTRHAVESGEVWGLCGFSICC